MEIVDAILSAPVLFGLVVAASLVLVAKAVISLLDKAPPLRVQLDKVNKLYHYIILITRIESIKWVLC